jgi:SpoVK/Ycf46/Vps4 family AAA+-type ATPase
MHKYYGESQEFVRKLFDRARELAPSVLFIDEIDGVVAERIDYDPDDVARARVINQFLVEPDGFEALEGVVVIGATNRIEIVDSALRRSGRFGHELEVPPPDEAERAEIFRVHLADRPIADAVTVDWLVAQTTEEYSGADIAKLCEWAARSAMRRTVSSNGASTELSRRDFRHAFAEIVPAGGAPADAGSPEYH